MNERGRRSKAAAEMDRCRTVADHGATVHFECNRAAARHWPVRPTGKFKVYDTAHDFY